MTAIEWLIEELENNGLSDIYLVSDITDKAKEMEKQQIIDAFEFGTKLEMMVVETVVDNIIKNNLKRNNNGKSK